MFRLRLVRLFLVVVSAWGLYVSLEYFCRKQTEGFTLNSILSKRDFDPRWQTRSLSPEEQQEVDDALSQTYHLFGRGGQCFAFLSADGNYVVKFFKQKTYTIPLWHHWIPPYLCEHYKEKKRNKRRDKLERDFFSYTFAFEQLQDRTGLLFIHLNHSENLKRRLTLIDRLHIAHQVDLDQMDFIVQRRAQMISPTIIDLIEKQRIDEAKALIDKIVELVLIRCQKGLEDWDPEVRTNCGLVGDQLIKIDVGRFVLNESMKTIEACRSELLRVLSPFQGWLNPISPLLAKYCNDAISQALNTLENNPTRPDR